MPTVPPVVVDRTAENSLVAVMAAYREIVMAIPHYEEEYGDCDAADVADELGPDIAAALTGLGASTNL